MIKYFEHPNQSHTPLFPSLDGLRGIAILMVLFGHYWSIASEGFQSRVPVVLWNIDITSIFLQAGYGVQLFFIMSAFLLYLPYARSGILKTPPTDIKTFYKRRFLRIYPAFFSCSIIGIAILYFWGGKLHIPYPTAENLISNLLFIQPIAVFRQGNTVAPYFLEGTWSLVVEVYFYLLLPLLALVFRKTIFLFIGSFSLISIAIYYREIIYQQIDTYQLPWQQKSTILLNLIPYLDAFLVGILVAQFFTWASTSPKLKQSKIPKILTGIGLFGFAYIFCFPFSSPHITIFGKDYLSIETYFFFNLSVGLLIFGLLMDSSIVSSFLSTKLLRFIGLISYSLFLIHVSLARFCAIPILNFFDLTNFEDRFAILFFYFSTYFFIFGCLFLFNI